jgi:hypothetical protein
MAVYGFTVRLTVFNEASKLAALEALKECLEGPADVDILEIRDELDRPMIGTYAPAKSEI